MQALDMHAHNPKYPVKNGWRALKQELINDMTARYMRFTLKLLVCGVLLVHAILVRADIVPANVVPNTQPDFQTVLAHGKSSIALDIDNDSLLMNRNDGFYSSGARLTQQYALGDASQLAVYGWRIGYEMYTASDIKFPPAQVRAPDHPYASLAGWRPVPRAAHWTLKPWLDLQSSVHGCFGNIFTDATAAVMLRAGMLGDLPSAPTKHVYLKLGARAVGYDAALQGGYFSKDNPHTVRPPFALQAAIVRRGNEIRDLPDDVGAQNFVRLQLVYSP